MTTPKAVETWYGGCKFRSRLEARHAVLFDKLGVRWEYEPQGYRVGEGKRPYLPDFWLPGLRVWVEVKGSMDQLDISLMTAAAGPAGLPATGNTREEHEARVLILGPVGRCGQLVDKDARPAGFGYPVHTLLTLKCGVVYQGSAWFDDDGLEWMPTRCAITDSDSRVRTEAQGTEWGNLVKGGILISDSRYPLAEDAWIAASSARFEHGESGEPR